MKNADRIFFFDTYAFAEIIYMNKNYDVYTKDITICTTRLNLMELHSGLIELKGKEFADRLYDRYLEFAIEPDNEILKNASRMKRTFKERNLSYIDCIGYLMARSRKIPFLTGDKQFKDLINVEYVK